MDKQAILTEFRKMINAQTTELIEVQKSIINRSDDAFDKIQSVIESNIQLWDELWNIEHNV
jgi:hypothetical protein